MSIEELEQQMDHARNESDCIEKSGKLIDALKAENERLKKALVGCMAAMSTTYDALEDFRASRTWNVNVCQNSLMSEYTKAKDALK